MLSRSLEIQMIKKSDDTVRFVASTGNSDRYGDIISQDGWQLDAYRRNPVVLLNHQTNQLPIGKGLVEVKDGNLMIDVEFDAEDELAQKVAHKARNGFLHAVSVGFNPVESISRAELPEEHKAYSEKGGNLFTKAELLEVSIVTIPANSEATTMGQKQLSLRGMIRQIIAQEIRAALEVDAPDGYHWMDYQDGPVLMEGDDADHDGASSSFEFEVIEEHDPEMLKGSKEDEDEKGYHDDEDSSEDEKGYHDDDEDKDKEMKPDEDEDKEQMKSFEALIRLLS